MDTNGHECRRREFRGFRRLNMSCRISCKWVTRLGRMRSAASEPHPSSADFEVCCIVGFQTRKPHAIARRADLEIGDWLTCSRSLGPAGLAFASFRQSLSPSPGRLKSAGLETCATTGGCLRAPLLVAARFDNSCGFVFIRGFMKSSFDVLLVTLGDLRLFFIAVMDVETVTERDALAGGHGEVAGAGRLLFKI